MIIIANKKICNASIGLPLPSHPPPPAHQSWAGSHLESLGQPSQPTQLYAGSWLAESRSCESLLLPFLPSCSPQFTHTQTNRVLVG